MSRIPAPGSPENLPPARPSRVPTRRTAASALEEKTSAVVRKASPPESPVILTSERPSRTPTPSTITSPLPGFTSPTAKSSLDQDQESSSSSDSIGAELTARRTSSLRFSPHGPRDQGSTSTQLTPGPEKKTNLETASSSDSIGGELTSRRTSSLRSSVHAPRGQGSTSTQRPAGKGSKADKIEPASVSSLKLESSMWVTKKPSHPAPKMPKKLSEAAQKELQQAQSTKLKEIHTHIPCWKKVDLERLATEGRLCSSLRDRFAYIAIEARNYLARFEDGLAQHGDLAQLAFTLSSRSNEPNDLSQSFTGLLNVIIDDATLADLSLGHLSLSEDLDERVPVELDVAKRLAVPGNLAALNEMEWIPDSLMYLDSRQTRDTAVKLISNLAHAVASMSGLLNHIHPAK